MDEIVRVQILPTGILPLLVADCLESPKEVERGMSASMQFTSEQAKEVGDKLGIDWSRFDVEQFRMGMNVELEHGVRDPSTNVTGNDPILTGKIALAHLNEFPDYYTRLAKMEEEAMRESSNASSEG